MKKEYAYPDTVVRFYDAIYDKMRSGIDQQYFNDKILACKGKVLEIGVGTGRFFIDAFNKGADIYGVDVNVNMLDIVKSKLEPENHNRLFHQDAAELDLDIKFDLIVMPFRVIQHITTVEAQLNLLNSVAKHLNEGGAFIFDTFLPNLTFLINGRPLKMDFEGEYEAGKGLRRYSSLTTNLVKQINYVTFKYEWQENDEWINEEWDFEMRYFFRYELEHLIGLSDLKLENIYGDYEENELNLQSKDFIVVCKK